MISLLHDNPLLLLFMIAAVGWPFPNVGYATVYPVAMITKIILAQVIHGWLLG